MTLVNAMGASVQQAGTVIVEIIPMIPDTVALAAVSAPIVLQRTSPVVKLDNVPATVYSIAVMMPQSATGAWEREVETATAVMTPKTPDIAVLAEKSVRIVLQQIRPAIVAENALATEVCPKSMMLENAMDAWEREAVTATAAMTPKTPDIAALAERSVRIVLRQIRPATVAENVNRL